MFIALEGIDGSGKGVQLGYLKDWLNEQGFKVTYARDPGDTPLGESIRSLLLTQTDYSICPLAEAGLFMSARAQLVNDVILPALNKGRIVLVDRFILSTIAYQGYANSLSSQDIDRLWKTCLFLSGGVFPDITVLLDCPPAISHKRLARPKDRIESRDQAYHARVLEGYRQAIQNWNKSAHGESFSIDSTGEPLLVFEQIKEILQPSLKTLRNA